MASVPTVVSVTNSYVCSEAGDRLADLAVHGELLAAAREQAMDRMVEDAQSVGADAIVCVRLATSTITDGSSEVLAYGTAVRLT